MSMTNDRGKRDAIPQPGVRTRHGASVSLFPCGSLQRRIGKPGKPRAKSHFGRKSHVFERALEGLRGLRLFVVPLPG
jgi:hypothetical protein